MDPEPPTDPARVYRGTATAYERYRRSCPSALVEALVRRSGLSASSSVVDLATGTGQLARHLRVLAGRTVAVASEPDFVDLGRRTTPDIEWLLGQAETIELDARVDLVTCANAFHRLDRDRAARNAWKMLKPSGWLALLWTDTPWTGGEPWQESMARVLATWTERLEAAPGTFAGDDPTPQVLFRNGFASVERIEVPHHESWTVDELVGFMRSTSFLNANVLGPHVDAFEHELRQRLAASQLSDHFTQEATAALDLAQPADATSAAATVLELVEQRRSSAPVMVAIDGRSGGGKSTLAAEIARSSPSCAVVEGDDFYAGGSEAHWDALSAAEKVANGIDWRRQRPVLEALRRGEPGSWNGFDWDRFDGSLRAEVTVCEPAGIVILEGAYSARPELSDLLDLRVLVDVPESVRLARLRARGGDEWHEQWFDRWSSAEDHYFAQVVPEAGFDLVL